METQTTQPNQGTISTLDQSGDFKVTWSHDNADEVEIARGTYEKLKKKGYAAFRMLDRGQRGEQIREFDPRAEQIIMVPPVVGG
jgi:hypothetical protein